LGYINIISFGSEDDKIGLGYEMFNASGKNEMNYEDFYKCYKALMLNWSMLLSEKLEISEIAIKGIFSQLDRGQKGFITKTEYFYQNYYKNTIKAI